MIGQTGMAVLAIPLVSWQINSLASKLIDLGLKLDCRLILYIFGYSPDATQLLCNLLYFGNSPTGSGF